MAFDKMNANAKLWVASLRSGTYQKNIGRLYRAGRFCVLGVLCDLYQKVVGDLRVIDRVNGERSYNSRDSMLPEEVTRWVGLNSSTGDFVSDSGGWDPLIVLNDGGMTFPALADLIESEPPGLFVEETDG
jgi:hypothetical protein